MRIGLQTWGTDGDIRPFLALAQGLSEAGHLVTLAYTPIGGVDIAPEKAQGVQLLRVFNRSAPIISDPYALAGKPGSFRGYTRLLNACYEPHTSEMFKASMELCRSNDLVVGHAVCHTLLTASQLHDCPRISLILTPSVLRSDEVSPIGRDLGKWGNALLWDIGGKLSARQWFSEAQRIREQHDLPKVKSLQDELFHSYRLTLVAASPNLCPPPPDSRPSVRFTGFLDRKMNKKTTLSREMTSFLEVGEPPVFLTFGSCMQFNTEASTRLLLKAAELADVRAIVQTEMEIPQTEYIFPVKHIEHAVVFPHCEIVVHHGGAGTTQSTLLAGRPSVVVAHGFDQLYWGKQLEDRGVGGRPLIRNSLTASELANEIKRVTRSSNLTANAEKLGQQMCEEQGVSAAVQEIERSMQGIA